MGLDIVSYLMGSESGNGGSGVTILTGDAEPSAQEGSNGQLYLKTTAVQLLDYIASPGGPWLSTGYIPTINSEFVMDMELESPYNSYDTPFGSRSGSVDVFVAYDGGTFRYLFGSSNQSVASIAGYYGQRVQMVLKNGRAAVEQDGITLVERTFSATLGTVTVPMGIFTLQTGLGVDMSSCRARGKLYGFKIYESGVLVRSYVPALDSNKEPCLYESFTGTSYYNQGSGSLLAGQPIGTLDSIVSAAYAKTNGAWNSLLGTSISDINTN